MGLSPGGPESETGPTRCACDNRPMRSVGTRRVDGESLADQGRLARTAALVRGTAWLVPRGVYRFASFDEADAWMNEMVLRTHEHLNRKTSSGSAER